MKIKFADDTVVDVSPVIEQKMFNNNENYGWIMNFSIITPMTSNEIDELLDSENINVLQLISDDGLKTKTINGYNKISMIAVRYNNDVFSSVDVQFTK